MNIRTRLGQIESRLPRRPDSPERLRADARLCLETMRGMGAHEIIDPLIDVLGTDTALGIVAKTISTPSTDNGPGAWFEALERAAAAKSLKSGTPKRRRKGK